MALSEIREATKKVKAFIMARVLESARPWEPINDEYLTSRELFRLVSGGGATTNYQYRELLHVCELAVQDDFNQNLLPDRLRDYFTDRLVKVIPFKGKTVSANGARVEYRVALSDLAQSKRSKALDIVLERIGENVGLSVHTRLGLRLLAGHANEPVSRVIDDLVRKAVREEHFGEEGAPRV